MTHTDPRDVVDQALALLRDAVPAPEPDALLETRLRARHRPAPRRRRRWTLSIAVLGLSGAAFAAGGGVEWIRGWVFGVEVEGRTSAGRVEGAGERSVPFALADGSSGEVRVRRDRAADGALRARIDIDRSGNGRVEREQSEDLFADQERQVSRLPLSALDDAAPLYAGQDPHGQPYELFATTGAPSRLLLLREDPEGPALLEVARVPFDLLAAGAHAEFTERADVALEIAFDDGRGAAFEFVWAPTPDGPGVSELETADGAVRVRVEDAPDRR